MKRRTFIKSATVLGGTVASGALAMPALSSASEGASGNPVRQFDVRTTIELTVPRPGAQVWLPLFHSDAAYQRVLGLQWESNAQASLATDPVFGARMLHARWQDTAAPQTLTVVQRIATWERHSGSGSASVTRAERDFWTRSTPAIPTGGIVGETARRIVGDHREPKARLRAIYDWVVANTWREASVPGCGRGNIVAMLKDGKLGGKCADINSLMIGLARAAGLPARDVYGIRLGESALFRSLGRSGTITGAQHCRAEVFLDGEGWFAVDPADVRKAILEEKRDPASPEIAALADRLFGAWESNWAGYNTATGITLPGAPDRPDYDFLMYPVGMTDKGEVNCLDSARFAYTIQSSELAG